MTDAAGGFLLGGRWAFGYGEQGTHSPVPRRLLRASHNVLGWIPTRVEFPLLEAESKGGAAIRDRSDPPQPHLPGLATSRTGFIEVLHW
jgi:hypothetical protein